MFSNLDLCGNCVSNSPNFRYLDLVSGCSVQLINQHARSGVAIEVQLGRKCLEKSTSLEADNFGKETVNDNTSLDHLSIRQETTKSYEKVIYLHIFLILLTSIPISEVRDISRSRSPRPLTL